ncbi:thiamine-phosphate kinase [Eikenella sp. NML96-A-049]|uniref:thiamine-phosphate kinase n=1 Tax=unclassified Eikenella TaxID=2639367 RepID=UPI0007E14E79|nr:MULTISPECIES: thiamine-phosphate kinase [unclassified Eikenella]OAM34554.1 thiamine-phosphate kinase [Eikenella sp. NML070372]OAM39295.1 thiamine-phosphate kinase [Eikenella sp. NML96-A-049]
MPQSTTKPLGEFDFIRRYLNAEQPADLELLLGIGDDAAIVRPRPGHDLCFSSDMLLAGRHFFPDVAPADLAHKILAVNISDMVAMGAQPRWVMLSAALPELNPGWLEAFSGSLFAILRQYGITLIGGDTTKGDLVFNVAITGELPAGLGLRRSSAQNGDDIWVSGQIGLAAAALHHIWQNIRLPENLFAECETARLRPTPRVSLGQALLPVATAAQDISDGLAQDLGHILRASNVGAELYADLVPTAPGLRQCLHEQTVYELILAGGDDYELLFTAPPQARQAVLAAAESSRTPVARIGRINDTGYLKLLRANGSELHLAHLGFDHFG